MCYTLKFIFRTYVIVYELLKTVPETSFDKLPQILKAHTLYSPPPPLESIQPPINFQLVSEPSIT